MKKVKQYLEIRSELTDVCDVAQLLVIWMIFSDASVRGSC
jgi:hypothetical protein